MTLHLLLAGWLSLFLAPLPGSKVPPVVPGPEIKQLPLGPEYEVPVTRPPKLSWKPGAYAAASLVVPETLALEKFDQWQFGPNWPLVEVGVVVVTDHADDPMRFMAFLVDVRQQRIAAVREGDKAKHLLTIGQMPAKVGDTGTHGSVPPTIMTLAGSGAVIIVRPPVPPGPAGVPKDLVAKILDAGTVAAFAGEMIGKVQPI